MAGPFLLAAGCGSGQQEPGEAVGEPELVLLGGPAAVVGQEGVGLGAGQRCVGGLGPFGCQPVPERAVGQQYVDAGALALVAVFAVRLAELGGVRVGGRGGVEDAV